MYISDIQSAGVQWFMWIYPSALWHGPQVISHPFSTAGTPSHIIICIYVCMYVCVCMYVYVSCVCN